MSVDSYVHALYGPGPLRTGLAGTLDGSAPPAPPTKVGAWLAVLGGMVLGGVGMFLTLRRSTAPNPSPSPAGGQTGNVQLVLPGFTHPNPSTPYHNTEGDFVNEYLHEACLAFEEHHDLNSDPYEDIEEKTLDRMVQDAETFFADHEIDLSWANAFTGAQAFWHVRNNDGMDGFIESGDYPDDVAKHLTEAARDAGPFPLYFGADGKIHGKPGTAENPTGGEYANAEWRKRQIILEPELVEQLSGWHSGMDAVYALSSTGASHLVSLSMIDAALPLLRRSEAQEKSDLANKQLSNAFPKGRAQRTLNLHGLTKLINDLEDVRTYWYEHSADNAGMDIDEVSYQYDGANYGLTREQEAQIVTRGG
jgi:hypothetical protein